MSDYLGIDLGTSAIKVGRFTPDGEMTASASLAYHAPSEHNVPFDRIWTALCDATREVLAGSDSPDGVAGIGISSQTNSFALVDASGEVLSPVFLWTGNWAGDEAAELNDRLGDRVIAEAVGMTALSGQLLAPKCLKLMRGEKGDESNYDAGVACLRAGHNWTHPLFWMLPDLVTARLCGRAVTDASLWSLTGLYDLNTEDWWPTMLEVLDVRREQLPELSSAGRFAGRLRQRAADALGLPAGVPVAVGALDHLAGAIGVGNVGPGVASVSTGTASCVVVTHDDRPAAMPGGVVGRHPGAVGKWYALAWSGLSSTGLNWYAGQTGVELPELLAAAGNVDAGADGWRAAPRDPNSGDAGFDFHREGRATGDLPTVAQATRAILERLTEEIARLVDSAAQGRRLEKLIAIGGGARSEVWMRMLEKRLGVTVFQPACLEASALGASRLAMAASPENGDAARFP